MATAIYLGLIMNAKDSMNGAHYLFFLVLIITYDIITLIK